MGVLSQAGRPSSRQGDMMADYPPIPVVHVDFVKNEWSAGVQRRVGWVEKSIIHLDVAYPGHLLAQIKRVLHADGLRGLTSYFDGSYFFATKPHTRDACPFKDSDELAMVSCPVPAD